MATRKKTTPRGTLFSDQVGKIKASAFNQKITLEKRDFGIIKHRIIGLDDAGRQKVRKLRGMFKIL